MNSNLEIYTIYKSPSDFPGDYVIKKWVFNPHPSQDLNFIFINSDLEMCRKEMKKFGLHRINRDVNDDPVILETWI